MEIQNSERRNSEYALLESQRELESQRRQLLKANQWADQARRERVHLCSRLEMKDHLHKECYARSCREIEELRIRCYQEEKTEKQRRLEERPTQHDQESRTVSLFFYDPDLLSSHDVPAFLIKLFFSSSSRKPCREVGMPRNTREDMSIPGNVSDHQHARRDPDELHNHSRNLPTLLAILRKKELRKMGAKNHCNQYLLLCFSVRARRKSLDDKQV